MVRRRAPSSIPSSRRKNLSIRRRASISLPKCARTPVRANVPTQATAPRRRCASSVRRGRAALINADVRSGRHILNTGDAEFRCVVCSRARSRESSLQTSPAASLSKQNSAPHLSDTPVGSPDSVAHDHAAGRIESLACDAGEFQRRAVRERHVTVETTDKHRRLQQ